MIELEFKLVERKGVGYIKILVFTYQFSKLPKFRSAFCKAVGGRSLGIAGRRLGLTVSMKDCVMCIFLLGCVCVLLIFSKDSVFVLAIIL